MNSIEMAANRSIRQNGPRAIGDAELVAAAQSGDLAAFGELTQRDSNRILRKIYRITNNWQDAEDVFQESLIKALLHIDTFQCKSSFSTWLTSIAINTALLLLRHERRTQKSPIHTGSEDIAQAELWDFRDLRDNPEQHLARQQREDMLRGAILQLPPVSRGVIQMQQNGDLSTREIAKSLGISEAACKSRLLRAKRVLKRYMQRETRRRLSNSRQHCAAPSFRMN